MGAVIGSLHQDIAVSPSSKRRRGLGLALCIRRTSKRWFCNGSYTYSLALSKGTKLDIEPLFDMAQVPARLGSVASLPVRRPNPPDVRLYFFEWGELRIGGDPTTLALPKP